MTTGFLTAWLDGVEQLVVRAPGILALLGEPNYELAIARRFAYDVWEDGDADGRVNDERPFFIVKESAINFRDVGADSLEPCGAVELYFTMDAGSVDDHKASKRAFCDYWSAILLHCGTEQGRPIFDVPATAHISLAGIQVTLFPQRSLPRRRSVDEPGSDYWEAAALFFIGQGP